MGAIHPCGLATAIALLVGLVVGGLAGALCLAACCVATMDEARSARGEGTHE